MIPFGAPEDTIDYLRLVSERHPNAIAMFADDGEKFGVWPETHKSVFEERWLARLFDLLAENQSWIHMTTPAEAIDRRGGHSRCRASLGSFAESESAGRRSGRIAFAGGRRNKRIGQRAQDGRGPAGAQATGG